MSENNSQEIGYHSDWRKNSKPETLKFRQEVGEMFQPLLEKNKENAVSMLRPFEAELSEAEKLPYLEVIKEAKSNLTELYKKVGIELSDGDFPEIILVEGKYGKILNFDNSPRKAAWEPETSTLFVFIGSKLELLIDAKSIHHELHHSIGRNKLIFPSQKSFKTVQAAQVGHITMAKESRGLVIEEGVVSHYGEEFVIHSTSSALIDAREKFSKRMRGVLRIDAPVSLNGKQDNARMFDVRREVSVKMKKVLGDDAPELLSIEQYSIKQLLLFGLRLGMPLKYANSREMVKMLSDISPVISNLLLETRMDSLKKRELMSEIDKVLGKGTTRKLFKMKFDGKETEEGLKLLREKLGEFEPTSFDKIIAEPS